MCTRLLILFIAAVFWSLPVSARAQLNDSGWYSIKAFLPQWNNSAVQLIIEGQVADKGVVQKDMYSFTGIIRQPKTAVLSLKKEGRTYFLPIFIEPGTIKVRDEGRRLVVYGTPLNETYEAVVNRFDSLALMQKGLAFTEYRNFKRMLSSNFIKENPTSILGLKLLDDFFYKDAAAEDTVYHALYMRLDSTLQRSFLGRRIGAEAAQRAATALGRQAPMFQLADTADIKQPLYRSGQYTLINFWASWCLPCRKEHPQLVALYKKYKDLGFTIRGVSLDQSKAAWLAAIKREGLLWPQLIDQQAFESKVVKQYGVQVVPTNFLLDPSGTIIDRNINTGVLAQKLAVLLEK